MPEMGETDGEIQRVDIDSYLSENCLYCLNANIAVCGLYETLINSKKGDDFRTNRPTCPEFCPQRIGKSFQSCR